MTDRLFDQLTKKELVWLPEFGIGYYPVRDFVYDQAYFDKYIAYVGSAIDEKLNSRRVELVKKYTNHEVVDIGIGCGRFVEACSGAKGFDVNPAGIDWLKKRDLWKDPWSEPVIACTFWDSLEHIQDFTGLLKNVQGWIFVSCPIYRDAQHVLQSKHFRKDEHYWYWTTGGFTQHMKSHGFKLLEHNLMEQECGREDIGTFVLQRL